MSMVEETLAKAKELKNRVLETVDTFRPKLLVKKPLTSFNLLQGEILEGQGIGTIVERVQTRIKELRSNIGVGLFREEASVENTPVAEAQVETTISSPQPVKKEKKEAMGIHW